VDLNPSKKKFTRFEVRNVRIDFPTLFLKWYKKRVKFIFRTCFGLVISVRAPGTAKVPAEVPEDSRVLRARCLCTQPLIASTPGSSPPERPGPHNITSQPWSDTTCPCNTASSTLSCLFQQKERDKAEVSTSRGGTEARCVRPWLTRDIV